MNPHASRTALFVAMVVCGCRHEAEGASGTPVAVVTPGTDDAGTPPTPDDGVDAAAPDAAAPPSDASSAEAEAPKVTPADMSAAPAYPASALYATFSSASARAKLIACYLPGKKRDPKLRGKVILKFTINTDGSAKPVANEGSNLPDDAVIDCVIKAVKTMRFQKPLEGTVTIVYPFIFRSSGDETLILPDVGKK